MYAMLTGLECTNTSVHSRHSLLYSEKYFIANFYPE